VCFFWVLVVVGIKQTIHTQLHLNCPNPAVFIFPHIQSNYLQPPPNSQAHAAEVKPAAAAAAPAAAADAALPAGVIDLRKSTFEEAAHEDAREHAVQQEAARLGEGMYDAADGFVFTGVVVPSNFTPEGESWCRRCVCTTCCSSFLTTTTFEQHPRLNRM
jgi:hypothetical protein